MPFELLADKGFRKEFEALPASAREGIQEALRGFIAHPLEHPKASRLHSTHYPGSFRLRVGSHRLLGIGLASQNLIFLTTLFTKKRESDYDQALQRHERRLRAQGPPIDDYVRSARRARR
jgi:mRNA-degrading endonuclease RelE of RelBE toxin-antitoxin system